MGRLLCLGPRLPGLHPRQQGLLGPPSWKEFVTHRALRAQEGLFSPRQPASFHLFTHSSLTQKPPMAPCHPQNSLTWPGFGSFYGSRNRPPPPPPRPSSSHLPAFSLHAFCSEGQMTADVSGHALLPCLGFCWVCPCLPEALSLPPWLPIPRSPRPSCLTPHLQGVILDPQLLPLSTLWLFILQLPASGDLSVLAFVSSIRLRPQRARRWGSHWTVWPNLGLAQMGSCLAFQFLRYVPACLGLSGSLSTSCELAGPGLW